MHEGTGGTSRAARYPVAPLLALTGLTISQLTRRHSISGATAKAGLTEPVADRIACAHGYHPLDIWPDWGTHTPQPTRTCADDRCATPFTPADPRQKYCTPDCRKRCVSREWKRRRYQTDPTWRARHIERNRAYRDEIGADAVNAAERRRYHRDAEARRAARRERYRRERGENKDSQDQATDVRHAGDTPGASQPPAHHPTMQETAA